MTRHRSVFASGRGLRGPLFCGTAFLAVWLLSATTATAQTEPGDATAADSAADFGIVIAPRRKLPKHAQAPAQPDAAASDDQNDDENGDGNGELPENGLPEIVPGPVASDYATVYESIPFRRAEYNANPSYRHEATMEILTGNPRPPRITIERTPAAPAPGFNPYNPPLLRYLFDFGRGPYSRYQHLSGYYGGYPRLFHR